jgi:hypothetical protein
LQEIKSAMENGAMQNISSAEVSVNN